MISRSWIGSIDTPESVAYNLRRYFKFNIDKDSGFNKTFWEKARDHLPEAPKEIIVALISALIGAIVGILISSNGSGVINR
jgi:hypothetical protein